MYLLHIYAQLPDTIFTVGEERRARGGGGRELSIRPGCAALESLIKFAKIHTAYNPAIRSSASASFFSPGGARGFSRCGLRERKFERAE